MGGGEVKFRFFETIDLKILFVCLEAFARLVSDFPITRHARICLLGCIRYMAMAGFMC